ncbi:hypothetical protein [Brevundimonas aurifodinae]|uniref:Uncharacterized protein n=1 Tax=Brevundimonas aurifodinae TaxID=1508312 RepID=A0ABV1NMG4_9CAUL
MPKKLPDPTLSTPQSALPKISRREDGLQSTREAFVRERKKRRRYGPSDKLKVDMKTGICEASGEALHYLPSILTVLTALRFAGWLIPLLSGVALVAAGLPSTAIKAVLSLFTRS